jgi:hypothetical protein
MLGAGFVTRPTLDVLSDAGVQVSVGKFCFSVFLESSLTYSSLSYIGERKEAL